MFDGGTGQAAGIPLVAIAVVFSYGDELVPQEISAGTCRSDEEQLAIEPLLLEPRESGRGYFWADAPWITESDGESRPF